jgi:hypothetical protein
VQAEHAREARWLSAGSECGFGPNAARAFTDEGRSAFANDARRLGPAPIEIPASYSALPERVMRRQIP